MSGFELNEGNNPGPTNSQSIDPFWDGGSITTQSAVVRSGRYAGRAGDATGVGNIGRWIPAVSGSDPINSVTRYCRVYHCFSALPQSTIRGVPVLDWGIDSGAFSVRLDDVGHTRLWDDQSDVQVGSDSTTLVVADSATWYRFELAITFNANGEVASAEYRLNGTTVASGSLATPYVAATFFSLGWVQSPGTNTAFCYSDDIAINDSTGTSENSWPGESKIVLLRPVSDSARGANWTAGAGGTTNLWDAIDNEPPVGKTLATATNTTQVKNVAKDRTGNYDTALGAYSAAVSSGGGGLSAGDTVRVVMPQFCTGGPATGTILRLVSNPASSGDTTLGALGNTNYPGIGWLWNRFDQIVHSPSVTLSTGPVMRIGKRQNSTNASESWFMGLYVDYVSP
jgi:hypothetical protein